MTTHESYHTDRFRAHWRRLYEGGGPHYRKLALTHSDYLKSKCGYSAADIEGLKREAEYASNNARRETT